MNILDFVIKVYGVNELVLSWKIQILQEGKSKKKKKAELTATTRNFI